MALIVTMANGGLQGYSGGGSTSGGAGNVLQPASSPAPTTFNPQPAYSGSTQLLQPTVNHTINQGGYTYSPTSTSGSTTGSGGSPTSPQLFYDYTGKSYTSSAAANAANANLEADYSTLKNSTFASIGDAVTAGGQGYHSSIQDYLDNRKLQQNQIDSDSVQNELAREQGYQGVLDMVGNGIRSGGVILANNNAGSSSAGEALAHAYGLMGRQQMSGIGNQFAQGQNKINTEQNNLTAADATELRHAGEDKVNVINSIVTNARTQLAQLNQSAAYASLPDRVDIEAKIAEVKQQALDALSAYDSSLSGGISANTPMSSGDVRAKATSLLTAGVAPESSFDFTSSVPPELQGTGQFASELPIFISPSAKKQTS